MVLAVISCGYPGSPAHATVTFSSNDVDVDTIATYHCEDGFELFGPSRRRCTSNGTWTPAGIPFCGTFTFILVSFLKLYWLNGQSYDNLLLSSIDQMTDLWVEWKNGCADVPAKFVFTTVFLFLFLFFFLLLQCVKYGNAIVNSGFKTVGCVI